MIGIGLDCLTAKPEVLTALVLNQREIAKLAEGAKFQDNFEGKHFTVEFTEEKLDEFIEDERTLPAGAACLLLVKGNIELFRSMLT